MCIPSITMLYEKPKKVNDIKGSSLLSPAHGRVGARATSFSFCISVPPPSGGRKRWAGFNPQNPLDFAQNGFGFRPTNTTITNLRNVPPRPRLRLGLRRDGWKLISKSPLIYLQNCPPKRGAPHNSKLYAG